MKWKKTTTTKKKEKKMKYISQSLTRETVSEWETYERMFYMDLLSEIGKLVEEFVVQMSWRGRL